MRVMLMKMSFFQLIELIMWEDVIDGGDYKKNPFRVLDEE